MKVVRLSAVLGIFLQASLTLAANGPFSAPPSGNLSSVARQHGLEQRALTPATRPPLQPVDREGMPMQPSRSAALSETAAAAAACVPSDFTSLSGSALVSKVKSCDTASINNLFSLTGPQAGAVFQESKMAAVATGLRDVAAGYPGDNSTQAEQLVLFLRAGYFVQFNDSADVGQYGATLKNAMRAALDTFFASASAYTASDANGEILMEAVTLIDSAMENARYLSRMVGILNRVDNSWLSSWFMRTAVNNVFVVVFNGHSRAGFPAAVQADPSIVDALYNFHNRWTSLLGTPNFFLTANAARELARFVQYAGTVQSKTRPLARDLLSRSMTTGPTAPVYVGVAENVNFYDSGNCSFYGTCNLQAQLAADVLPIAFSCSATLHIRAQQMTSTELSNTCASQATEETRFHNMLQTGRVPVSGDLNNDLEMVVFNSSTDYQTYAGAMFGVSTNNGGIYIEGNPADPNNQGRFVAYEAEWLRPAFVIWNLNHEYVHYLDGRFDMKGDFNTYLTASTVWWLEGLAEYVAYVANNPTALDAVRNGPHVNLSTIFRNDYNSGDLRVYRWGYLGVRFMFERHRNDVTTMLGYFRAGNYSTYNNFLLSTLNTAYNSEFLSWMTQVLGGGTGNRSPVANFSFTTNGLTAAFTDGSSDPDGTIASRSWSFGDGTTSTATNPTKTYSAAGTYTVTLTVSDNVGATNSTSRSVTMSTGGGLPECTFSDTRQLGKNCKRSNRSAATGNYDFMYISLPTGVTQLRITVSGGTGNADLYANSSTWADATHFQALSTNAGNSESLTINNPPAGLYYISLRAISAFSGVTIGTQY